MNPTILGLGPGFLNQGPTLGLRACGLRASGLRFRISTYVHTIARSFDRQLGKRHRRHSAPIAVLLRHFFWV